MLVADGLESLRRKRIAFTSQRHRNERPDTGQPSLPRHLLVVVTMPPHTHRLLVLTLSDAQILRRGHPERRSTDVPTPVGMFQVRAPGLRTEFPPLRALDTTPGNLRRAATSFIGRESEVAEVEAALRAHRLVTFTRIENPYPNVPVPAGADPDAWLGDPEAPYRVIHGLGRGVHQGSTTCSWGRLQSSGPTVVDQRRIEQGAEQIRRTARVS